MPEEFYIAFTFKELDFSTDALLAPFNKNNGIAYQLTEEDSKFRDLGKPSYHAAVNEVSGKIVAASGVPLSWEDGEISDEYVSVELDDKEKFWFGTLETWISSDSQYAGIGRIVEQSIEEALTPELSSKVSLGDLRRGLGLAFRGTHQDAKSNFNDFLLRKWVDAESIDNFMASLKTQLVDNLRAKAMSLLHDR